MGFLKLLVLGFALCSLSFSQNVSSNTGDKATDLLFHAGSFTGYNRDYNRMVKDADDKILNYVDKTYSCKDLKVAAFAKEKESAHWYYSVKLTGGVR